MINKFWLNFGVVFSAELREVGKSLIENKFLASSFFLQVGRFFCFFAHPKQEKESIGSLAEWLGSGLQNRLRRFESARNLNLL